MIMVSARDVAAFILHEYGEMDAYKLQKLVYYAQGWTLGLTGGPLFPEPLQAWKKGPVSRAVFGEHQGAYQVRSLPGGNADALSTMQAAFLRRVLATHACKSGDALVRDTHSEAPWLSARVGLADGAHGSREITQDSMREFFGNPVIQGILQTTADDEKVIKELADLDRAGR
jgi:uncharacterized phage-associated protein